MKRRFIRGAVLTALVLLNVARSSADAPPQLDGRWELVALTQDAQPAPDEALNDAHVDIERGKMVFHLPARPNYPDLQIRYEIVPGGIDLQLTHGDIDSALRKGEDVITAKGDWELTRFGSLFTTRTTLSVDRQSPLQKT